MSQNKVCLITGASRGIGAATARRMAALGYHVIINYHRSQDTATALVREVSASGHSAEAVCSDVTDGEAVRAMLQRVGAEHGKLDVLVHAAAVPLVPKRVSDLDWSAEVLPQLEVNALGLLNVVQAAGRLLSADSRLIVLLTDALFHTPPVQMGAYLTAKGALWGMVRAVARELQPRGVRVNTVSPSMTDTELLGNYPERAREIFARDHPQGRLATPDEIAAVVAALATDAGSYLHGTNVVVNGGAAM